VEVLGAAQREQARVFLDEALGEAAGSGCAPVQQTERAQERQDHTGRADRRLPLGP
jgi:hypothetical protein